MTPSSPRGRREASTRTAEEPGDATGAAEGREAREPRENREGRGTRENRENRDGRDGREGRESRNGGRWRRRERAPRPDGPPPKSLDIADLEAQTLDQLIELATEQGIENPQTFAKQDLLFRILRNQDAAAS